MDKLFVIRKYIKAKDAKQAIKLEKSQPVDDVWVDEDWKKTNYESKEIGFNDSRQ